MPDAEVAGGLPGKLKSGGHFRSHWGALETATVMVMIRRAVFVLVVVAGRSVVVAGFAAVAGFLVANRVMGGICGNGLQTQPGENTECQKPFEIPLHRREYPA